MKIIFITPGMNFGGAERVMSILSNEWTSMGHEVRIYITASTAECVYSLDERIKTDYFANPENIRFFQGYLIKSIRAYIKANKPDVVISFMNDVCAYTALAITGLGIPLIYSERNDPDRVNQGRKDKIFRKIVERCASKFVFQTDGAKAKYKLSRRKKTAVILNPVDTANYPSHDFSKIKREIVAVGRLEPQKNHKLLIDAFALIAEKYPDYCLTIFGEGKLRTALQEQVDALCLKSRVNLPGAVKDVQNRIKDAAIYVMTSDYEGLPNALIEAMAMGLPCVSTDCSPGGARMLIQNQENGFLVPCGDKEKLADAMEYVLKNPDVAIQIGNKAIEIREKTDCKKIAMEWLLFIAQ